MKTLAIIGASYLQRPLVVKAKEMGLRTICFAWTDGSVCLEICDVFYPISIVEKEEILAICRQEHIDGICTIASDVAAPTVAYVAEHMGLTGNTYESAVRANNKYAMRQAFVAAGVDCPKFLCVSGADVATLAAIHTSLSLPIIVKPTDRSGSLGVARVDDWESLPTALSSALSFSFAHEAMVEEYVEGREISVEFISYQGKHYPLQITDKVTTGAPHFVELEHHQPASLSKVMFREIYSITDKALNALGIMNGASHSEYRITQDGRVVVMEIGGRMGGDFIGSDLVQLSTGYDFVRGVIEVALGEFKEPKRSQHLYSGVFFLCKQTESIKQQMEDTFAHPESHPEVVEVNITNKELKEVTFSAQRSGYMIYQADKKIEIL